MECRLFFSKFKNEATVSRMQEKFASTSKSRSARQTDAFKLGLQTALNLKRRESIVGTDGVTLRCRAHDCPGNKSYTSYALEGVTNNEYCQPCYKIGHSRFLYCSGCGHQRRDRESRCGHCGKQFVLVVSYPQSS